MGTASSQRQEYFERPEAHEMRLRNGPAALRAASDILDELDAAGWRALCEDAFTLWISPEVVLALVLQRRTSWLVLGASNTGSSAVYALYDGGLRYFGEPLERLDVTLGQPTPLVIEIPEMEHPALSWARALIEELEAQVPTLAPADRDLPIAERFLRLHAARTATATMERKLETVRSLLWEAGIDPLYE